MTYEISTSFIVYAKATSGSNIRQEEVSAMLAGCGDIMHRRRRWGMVSGALLLCAGLSSAERQTAPTAQSDPQLPYIPSLDTTAMDRTADPCVDFYQFACGGWMKNNPIPADQSSWTTYGRMQDDNRALLRALLE